MTVKQKVIHRYKQYSDLTLENGFEEKALKARDRKKKKERIERLPKERYAVKREVIGVKNVDNPKEETKYDWHPAKKTTYAIQLDIPQYYLPNGEKKVEEIDSFEKYSESLLQHMTDAYLDYSYTLEKFEIDFSISGKLQKDLLEIIQGTAEQRNEWTSHKTSAENISVYRMQYSENSLIFLIDCDSEKILAMLRDGTCDKIIDVIENKAPDVKYIYANYSDELSQVIQSRLPGVIYLTDFMQIPAFIDDLISQKITRECRSSLRKYLRKIENILDTHKTYATLKKAMHEQIIVLNELAKQFPEEPICKAIEEFYAAYQNYQTFGIENKSMNQLYIAYLYLRKTVKNILGSKTYSGRRLFFHICHKNDALLKKVCDMDEEEIKSLKYGTKGGNCEGIKPTRITTKIYQQLWADAREIYSPNFITIDDNTNGRYIDKDGINIWNFIGLVLGDIGYEINPEVFFEYDISNLCSQDVYSDLEVFKGNDVMIRINSPTLHTPTNSLDAVLERRSSSETWVAVETWTQTATDENGLFLTERRTVEPNFFYHVKCNHHKGAKTFTTCSEEIWVGMNREEYQTLKKSGYFDDK